MSRNSLLETGAISKIWVTATELEPTPTLIVNEHSTIYPNWPNDWAMLWALICMVHRLCVLSCYIHVWSESTLSNDLNVTELLTWNRCDIWSLSDCNRIQTHTDLRTLNYLTKLAKWVEWMSHSKRVCNMIKTHSQCTLQINSAQQSSIIWPVWLNGWVFV